MALTSKKFERIYSKTGSDADKISTSVFNEMKEDFDNNHYLNDMGQLRVLGPVLYQMQLMQDELDYLRTEISSNKDNKTVIGSSTTLSFSDLTLTNKGAYELTVIATRDFGGKIGSQTKSVTLTLK
jgi:hypothetical protein